MTQRNYAKSFPKGFKSNNDRRYKQPNPQIRDLSLVLRKEFPEQTALQFKVKGVPILLATLVTSGIASQNLSLSSARILSFAARFLAFTEFRIVKAIMKIRFFSSSEPGLLLYWCTEDDAAAPNATAAIDAPTKQVNMSDITKSHSIVYVPKDPAQQTWTLVSSGAPVIGYFKCYSDNTNFGSKITAGNVATISFDFEVQFRGLI